MSHERSVAIDGPAGSGKSTVARGLARALGYRYVSTGDIYRALALAVLRNGIDPHNEKDVSSLARKVTIEVEESDDGSQITVLDGEDVSDLIKQPEVDAVVSPVSAHAEVRAWLVDLQRRLADERDVVMDGRDIGTVVLARSKHKFFLTASAEERARRRWKEYVAKGRNVDFDTVLKEVQARDTIDSGRAVAPLRVAPDAVVVDCTHMTVQEVIDEMLRKLGRADLCSTMS
jgi:cytidylate kinase